MIRATRLLVAAALLLSDEYEKDRLQRIKAWFDKHLQ
jgi:hypothetical protein